MFCIKCGKQIPDESVFCMGCGTKVPQLNITQTNVNTPMPEVIAPKPPMAKPIFDDEATRVVITKKVVEEPTTVVSSMKPKSFETSIEPPVEEEIQEENEIFSHSEPQEIDVFSNSADVSEEIPSKIEEPEVVEEIFSNSVEESNDIFSNSDEAKEPESDDVQETDEIFSHSHFAPQMKMAKPVFEDDSDDKTVFLGAYEQEQVKEEPAQIKIAPPVVPQIAVPVVPQVELPAEEDKESPVIEGNELPENRPVMPQVAPPMGVAPPVKPIAPPVIRQTRKNRDMTVTMSRRNDPIPANYGVSMREDRISPPVMQNFDAPQFGGMPANDFVPEPVKKKRKKIHPMAIILPIVSVILAVAIIFGSIYLFTDPKDKYFVSKKVTVYYGEDGSVTSKSTREYFAEGELSLYKDEYEGEVTDEDKYERNEDGRIIKITEGVGDDKIVYRFDEYEKDGKLYVSTGKATVDGVTYKIELSYKKDELVRKKEFTDNVITYSYEKEDNIETLIYYDEGEVTSTYIYEYDKKDNLVRKEYKNETDSSEDYVETYKYDKKENMLEYVCTNSDGDVTNKLVCEYDKNGNRTKAVEYDEEDNIVMQFTAKYNKYDIIVEYEQRDENDVVTQTAKLKEESKSKIVVDYYDENDVLLGYYEYTIEKGKLTEAKLYDGKSDTLLQHVKYNKYGLVTEEKEYREDGTLSSKTTYEYAKKK